MADDAPSELLARRHQMFPVLTDAEIARIRRFGTVRHYRRGERLFAVGEPGPGMFVVLKGVVAISQRDGLGHVVPIVHQGPGHFLAEVGTLSGRPALVDGHAEEDVETLLVLPGQLRALIIAEADMGERLVRALILRRVALIEAGHSGPVLIGQPRSADVLRLQNFLRRNGHPHHVVDASVDVDAAALMEEYGAAVGEALVVCPDGSVLLNPSADTLARCIGMVDTAQRDELFDVAVVGAQAVSLDCTRQAAEGVLSIGLADGRRLKARTVVIASGARYRRPSVPRLCDFEGRGVWYWASAIEAKMCAQTEVALVGGGNSAGQAAVFLAQHAARVFMLVRGPSLAASMSRYLIDRIEATSNIDVLPHTELTRLYGDDGIAGVTWRDYRAGSEQERARPNVILFVGAEPETSWLE